MLSIKPENGDGDFDFSRSSAATRVNAQGLVENVQIISSELVSNGNFSQIGTEEVSNGNFSQEGSELVTNGNFATDSDWNKGTGWSIANGQATCDGTNLAYLTQTGVLNTGTPYKVQFDIVDYTSGSVKYRDNGLVSGQSFSGVGSYTDYVTAGGGQFRLMSENFIGSIDNVSVKEVGQNWTLGSGWSIGEDKAISDGTINQSLLQPNLFTIGKSYKINFTISDVVGSLDARIWMATGGSKIEVNANGNYTTYWQADGTNLYTTTLSTNTATYSITNISVKEVGQDWTFGSGWSVDQANSKAVFDYDSSIQKIYTSNLVLNSNSNYKLSFEIKDILSGTPSIFIANSGGSVGYNGNYTDYSEGVYTFTFSPSSNQTSLAFFSRFSDFSITNISVKEITDDTDIPRINYSGFSYQDSLGSELVVNGDFSTDSNWSQLTNSSIINGKLVFNGSGLPRQANVFQSNKTFKITLNVSDYTSGQVRVVSSGYANVSNYFNSVGVYTFYFNCGSLSTTEVFIQSLSFIGSIDNISVKEVTGQEVVPDSGCGVWLLEPQSTNLVTYSEDFSQSSWQKLNSTIVSNSTISPNGSLNSDLLQETSANSIHYLREVSTVTSGVEYTLSFFAKKKDYDYIQYSRTVDGSSYANFNISNGTLGNNSGTDILNHQIEDYGNGWYRCIVNITTSSTSTGFGITLLQNDVTSRYESYLGDGSSGTYIWGAQLEQQSYATSYIPTNGATNTRLQDIANNSGNSTLINSTEGVLYAEIAALANDGTIRYLSLSDGTSNNRVTMLYYSSSNNIRMIVSSNGTNYADKNYGVSSVLDFHKIAIKYKENDFALWVDGIKAKTDNSGNAPIGLDNLSFSVGGGGNFYGKVKAVAVYKEALTDAQLQSLTTI